MCVHIYIYMSRIFTKNPQTYTLEIQRNPYFYIVLSLSILCLILTLLYIFKENIKSISLYRVQKKLEQWAFICLYCTG